MKTNRSHARREGAILAVVMVILIAFSLIVLSLYHLGTHSAREAIYEKQRAQAFWLAEAGRQWSIADLYADGDGTTSALAIDSNTNHTFEVTADDDEENTFYSVGTVRAGDRTIQRAVKFSVSYVAPLFEKAIHAGGAYGSNWTFRIRGDIYGTVDGPRAPQSSDPFAYLPGGNDIMIGDVAINGNVAIENQAKITANTDAGYYGDLDASGTYVHTAADPVAGVERTGASAEIDSNPDLAAMSYEVNNDYDIAAIFAANSVTSGRLPSTHPLHNVVVLRENSTTTGQDFYFEPTSMSGGDPAGAGASLDLGDQVVYYVDGHVWFDSSSTFGFSIDGQATIVSTRDIHLSDNVIYENSGTEAVSGNAPDLLALIALGQLDNAGSVTDGGDIYFGDGEYGTTYKVEAFMFANDDFLYNTKASTGEQTEPSTGFVVNGNFMAIDQVTIQRDWYTYTDEAGTEERRAAVYDSSSSSWKDSETGDEVAAADVRHYAMQVEYDERIKNSELQVEGLPKGNGDIFNGLDLWEEVDVP